MDGHHLILGELVDFLTGETLQDTHDERYRQDLARLLVEELAYSKEDIEPRCDLMVQAGGKRAIVKVDFQITLSGKTCMIVKYGPGSIVTRHRPALAASRLLKPYQIPTVVVTNGEDADVLDGRTGKLTGRGLDSIPSKIMLIETARNTGFEAISEKRVEVESRIVYAYEVDGSCPCDDTICHL
jgi:Type I restriction enzyme R protein N terminus (HSDR_N)